MKDGEDPNLTNPVLEPEAEESLDPNDPDVQMLDAAAHLNRHQNVNRQPSVIEVPDENDRLQGSLSHSTQAESLHPSREPSVPPQSIQNSQSSPQRNGEDYYHNAVQPEVSPLAPESTDQSEVNGDGYFPAVPGSNGIVANAQPANIGSHPAVILPDPSSLPPPGASGFHTSRPPTTDSLHSFPPPSVGKSDPDVKSPAPIATYPSPPPSASNPSKNSQPPAPSRQMPQTPIQPPFPTPVAPVKHTAPSLPVVPPPDASHAVYSTDEEAVTKAQKHARWAISALNFEDVNTAVQELNRALESLGAR